MDEKTLDSIAWLISRKLLDDRDFVDAVEASPEPCRATIYKFGEDTGLYDPEDLDENHNDDFWALADLFRNYAWGTDWN